MSLNINSVLYQKSGVDSVNALNVANRILSQSAAKQNVVQVQNIDYSKFNRSTLGLDLYSPRTGVELQRQVAQMQAGLYMQSINVAQLNSKAAMNLYSAQAVQKNVSLTQSVEQKDVLPQLQDIKTPANTIQTINIQDKNPNSSNGFNPFAPSEGSATKSQNGDLLN